MLFSLKSIRQKALSKLMIPLQQISLLVMLPLISEHPNYKKAVDMNDDGLINTLDFQDLRIRLINDGRIIKGFVKE